VLIDLVGQVRANRSKVFSLPQPDDICSFVSEAFAEMEQELGIAAMARIAGFGIALPFRLWEWSEAIGAPSDAMAIWRETDLREMISIMFAFPVYMQNDGTAACGAELAFGKRRDLHDFVYFHIGSFVGGGLGRVRHLL
jgi:predicted NBD/HSP70 family sugar kinase